MSAPLRVLYVVQHAARNRILNGLVDHLVGQVDYTVAVLDDGGPMAEDLARRGVSLRALSALDFRALPLATARLRAVLREGWDLVQSNGYLPALETEISRAGTSVPSLLARHHNREHYVRGGALHVRLDAWSARRARHVLAVSEAVRGTLLEEGVPAERISVVPNGVDWGGLVVDEKEAERWRCAFDAEPLLVAVGRLDPIKDYTTLLCAAAAVLAQRPRGMLVVAGAGAPGERERLDALGESLGVGDRVRFLGWVPDIQNLLAAADCLVQSSLDESFGQSVVEAMGLGVPVAVTSPGGLAEIVRPWYGALAPGDADALAARVLALTEDREAARVRAAEAAADVRDRYSVERMADGHLDVYRRLVGEVVA